jgi:hypothetical protein
MKLVEVGMIDYGDLPQQRALLEQRESKLGPLGLLFVPI